MEEEQSELLPVCAEGHLSASETPTSPEICPRGFLCWPHREVWSSERFRCSQATGLTNTNVKGVNQQKIKERRKGDATENNRVGLLESGGAAVRSCSTDPRRPRAASPASPQIASRASTILYRECYPLFKKIKDRKKGERLTCAQSYNLSVGKIIFV